MPAILLDLTGSECWQFRPPESILHQHNKFQQNLTMRGLVIDDSTNFPGKF